MREQMHVRIVPMNADHLDEIARNKLPQLARTMGIPLERLYADLAEIKKLNPCPGNLISDVHPVYLVPEVSVEKDGGEYKVVADDSHIPHLRISKYYLKLLEDPNTPEDVRSYIRAKITSGNGLMKSLEQRQKTIKRIADVIVAAQKNIMMILSLILRLSKTRAV